MANWGLPTTGDLYTDLVNGLKDRDVDSATMFKTLPTNPVTDMVRWDPLSNKFDVYDGAAWVSLSSAYQINVTQFDGQNSSFYRSASNLNVGTLLGARFNDSSHGNRSGGSSHSSVVSNGNSGFMTGSDKNKLNNIETAATADQSATEILNLLLTVSSSDGGSGLNASTVNGIFPNSSPSSNTLVTRNGSGYIYANFFNTSAALTTSNPTTVLVETNNDGFLRRQTKSNFISNLGLALANHNHAGVYEPVIVKNTAFNRNFGVALNNVAQGNHSHAGVYNQVIGTDTDISYSGASVLSSITMTDGVIQGHTARNLTPANIGAAALNSPAFTGTPSAPTPVLGTNNAQLATTAFVANNDLQAKSELNNYHDFVESTPEYFIKFLQNTSLSKKIECKILNSGIYSIRISLYLWTDAFGGTEIQSPGSGTCFLYVNGVTENFSVADYGPNNSILYNTSNFTLNKDDLIQLYVIVSGSTSNADNYQPSISISSSLGKIANIEKIIF